MFVFFVHCVYIRANEQMNDDDEREFIKWIGSRGG